MKYAFILLIGLFGCVGTDYVDDPIIGEKIILADETIALIPGQQYQAFAEYYDQYGIARDVAFTWESSEPSIADVTSAGLIMAKTVGQSLVQPSYKNFLGPHIMVTVVSDPDAVATVEIVPVTTSLAVGAKVQLQAVVKNINGNVLNGKVVEWFSENSSIISVTASGLVEAIGNGIAAVHAKVEGVKSNNLSFTVNGMVRSAMFVSAGGYQTVGTAKLEIVNNQLILTFSSDFDTDFALGTFIYLANSTNGSTVRSTGFEVGQITTDGAKTFNITQLNPNIGLNDYRYVIVLCRPASVTFGYADLK
jgi:Bacterial Ig-like domain (group 2)/Electron transfer DM13